MYRARRIGATVLAVLTAILLLLSSLGIWADRYLLDSQRFTDSANGLLDDEDVQDALAVAITDQISQAAGTDLRIVQPFISSIVTGVVQSSQFQSVFDAAVLRAHQAIVGGGARNAVLNLTDVVDRVRATIEPIAPDIADKIPKGEKLRLTILDKTQLDTVYDTLEFVKDLVVLLTVLTVVCFAAALALSPRRWKTLALIGWVVFGVFVARLVAQRVGRGIVGDLSDVPEYSAAAQSAYKVVLHGLLVQTWIIVIVALLVALFAGWTDRHGGWAGVVATAKQGGTWAKAQLPTRTPAPTPALVTVGAGPVAEGEAAAPEAPTGETEEVGARAVVEGVLAPRLPEPRTSPRTVHWWRAAGLLALGLFAVLSPGSLTTLAVVLLGIAAIYLAVTEGIAAWGSPRAPKPADAAADAPADTTDGSAESTDA